MYIVGFLKSLVTPRKWLSVLYFLANQALVFGVFHLLGNASGAANPEKWGWIGIILNLVAMLAMLSPLGEAIIRYREHATPISEREYPTACRLFREVCQDAQRIDKTAPKNIRLYEMKVRDINAAATGRHTVIATTALLNLVESGRISSSQFKGVLAHELGHICHSDTSLTLGIVVSGGLLQLFLCAYVFFINIFARLIAIFSIVFANLFVIVFGRSVTFLFDVWSKIGVLLTNATSRKDEFAADHFAGECGYAYPLCEFLQALDPSSVRGSFLSVLAETHPATVDRVEALHRDFSAV